MKHFLSFVSALSFALAADDAASHDITGLVVEQNSLTPEAAAKIDEVQTYRNIIAARAGSSPDREGLEGVVREALRWPQEVVTVCFFDGVEESRDQVAQVAVKWTNGTGIRLDFGPSGRRTECTLESRSDIRVSFEGQGYWSYVGTLASSIEADKQTLNLSGMGDGAQLSAADRGTVLHEFGHALGFEHEHQSPAANCDEQFNWSYLYRALGWPKEKVDRNMRKLRQDSRRDRLFVTDFDKSSIMLYSLEPRAFKGLTASPCFIARSNNDLSETDIDTHPGHVSAE